MGMAASWLDDTAAFNGLNYTLVHFYRLWCRRIIATPNTLMPAPSAACANRPDLSRQSPLTVQVLIVIRPLAIKPFDSSSQFASNTGDLSALDDRSEPDN
jgi:hypothetical protein